MSNYDERLNELRTKMARKKHLESILPEMNKQKSELEQKVKELESIKTKEAHDVEKIEGGSLASFFYNVVGKKGEKLDKERQEAYEANVKYDAAVSDLAALNADIDAVTYEKEQLFGCEVQYTKVFEEKLEYIIETDPVASGQLKELEEKITYIEGQEMEIREAIAAGKQALAASDEVLGCLSDADGWSTWDMFGGGLLVDIKKHKALDDAQLAVQTLQMRLRRFKTELADITVHADINVRVEGFLHFADLFFDDLFTDWKVRDKIHASIDSAETTHNKIKDVMFKLTAMKEAAEEQKADLRKQIENIVLKK